MLLYGIYRRRCKVEKQIIYKISEVLGAILMAYHIILKLFVGYISFSRVFFFVGVILFIYGFMELRYKLDLWGHIPPIFRKIIAILFIISLSVFLIIESIVVINGFKTDNDKPDYIMVLGAGLRGTKISSSLEERLKSALEFNKEYPDVPIIVSGGQGKGEDISEAVAMKSYLINNGIDKDLIIMEDKSTSTYENFLYTYELLNKRDEAEQPKITVITNSFHMYRAKYLGEKIGFKCYGYPAKTLKSSAIIFYVREVFAVIKAYLS